MPNCQVECRSAKVQRRQKNYAEMSSNADEANRLHGAVYQTSIDEPHERLMFSRESTPLFIYTRCEGPDQKLDTSCTRIALAYRCALGHPC
jgi:hypothetical protein